MEYVRKWVVDGQEFGTRLEAEQYEARLRVYHIVGVSDVADALIERAEEVVAILKPYLPVRRRAPKGNGGDITAKAVSAKAKREAVSAHA